MGRLRDGAPYFLDDPVQHSEAKHKADRHDEDRPKAVDDLECHIDQGAEIQRQRGRNKCDIHFFSPPFIVILYAADDHYDQRAEYSQEKTEHKEQHRPEDNIWGEQIGSNKNEIAEWHQIHRLILSAR
jgi:hypothetical protein